MLDGLWHGDALRLFAVPVETFVNNANVGDQLLAADPLRVLIAFSTVSSTICVSTSPTAQQQQGFNHTGSLPPLILTWKEHGPLVCQAWYLTAGISATFTIFTIRQPLDPADNGFPNLTQQPAGDWWNVPGVVDRQRRNRRIIPGTNRRLRDALESYRAP